MYDKAWYNKKETNTMNKDNDINDEVAFVCIVEKVIFHNWNLKLWE